MDQQQQPEQQQENPDMFQQSINLAHWLQNNQQQYEHYYQQMHRDTQQLLGQERREGLQKLLRIY
jgi:hypothetical protein